MARRDYPLLYRICEKGSDTDARLTAAIRAIKLGAPPKDGTVLGSDDPVDVFLTAFASAWTKNVVDKFFVTPDSQPKAVVSYIQRLKIDTPESILQSYDMAVNTDLQGRAVGAMYESLDEAAALAEQAVKLRRIMRDSPTLSRTA